MAGFVPEVIVSGIKLDLSIVNICNLGADFVQEIPVMGYDDDCILKIDQEFFQPGDGVQIQMVGRLIQKQNVRVAEQCLGKKDLDLLRAIQILHNLIVIFRGNAKAIQKSSGIGFCPPSGEFRLQLAGFYAIFI